MYYTDDNKKTAVALGYDPKKDKAPRVLASGHNSLAEAIIAEAQKHGVKIHRDKELVKFLAILEINAYVPKEVYEVVAKILAYIYNKDKELSHKLNNE